jgi:hypothetical protein
MVDLPQIEAIDQPVLDGAALQDSDKGGTRQVRSQQTTTDCSRAGRQ